MLLKRTRAEWCLDFFSLVIQGLFIPFLQITIIYKLFSVTMPNLKEKFQFQFLILFVCSFVAIDFFYYWNHRLLHHELFWRWHSTHHSSKKMDIFVTSRNTLICHFMILYWWSIPLISFMVKDPSGIFWAMVLNSILDVWRHSGFNTPKLIKKTLGAVFILPEDHEWHHGGFVPLPGKSGVNFGANLRLWDRIFKTEFVSRGRCLDVGTSVSLDFFNLLFLPKLKGEFK